MDERVEQSAEPVANPSPDQVPQAILEGSKEDDGAEGSEKADLDKDLHDRFEGINLCGEEEAELDFLEEIEDLMRNAWEAAQDVTFKTKASNMFLAQFHCLGDWNRVMEGGPWIFRGVALVFSEYDGFSNVEDYKLDRIPVWARIQGVPEGLMKKKVLAEKVAKKVGEPPVTVIVTEGRLNPSRYLWVRVFLDLSKPLVRFVPITLRESKKYPVQYERLPDFCNFCGMMGHVVTECVDGIHEDDKCEWGDFLRVIFEPNLPPGPGRTGGNRGGFAGRGRGRMRYPGEANEAEFVDMEVEVDGDPPGNRVTRKRIIRSDGTVNTRDGVPPMLPRQGRVADQVNLLEYGKEAIEMRDR
ncbi:hypothetical protein QYE76_044403 [Lolium multiflorum]|uniref:Zinc knuckle CX2CX4HX4C domain-containing protein n=1 Tax=Lolium multiflorum TaxID=4521 RepID=A0AAD8TIK3_LOLMU|nr:hypothetical protein QYE76_044403 [Lolium multiflorum]